MIKVTVKQLKDALLRKDAPLFTGELNLTLVGIRATDTGTFKDRLCVLHEDAEGKTQMKTYPIMTDILKPGHYPDCWQIGSHQGKYIALVQRGPMTICRNAHQEQTGYFGINLHRTGVNPHSLQSDTVSAGCQVFANADDFDAVMALAQQSAAKHGNRFSYTLLDEVDVCQPAQSKEAQAHA